MEKCIGCELCAGVCPAKCIYVRGADNDPEAPSSPGERYGYVYEINYLRCIHCDLCVEACPTEAITETKLFEFSFTNRQDAIYTKTELLVDEDGKPQRMPWEDWRDGEDRDTSGWVRATSPSGDASFVGQVGWSGELGYGIRPPEPADEAANAAPADGREGRVALATARLHRRDADGDRRSDRGRRAQQGGARGVEPRAHAVRRRRALRRHGGALLGRRPGDRLRRGDRRAHPVRDHAPRRRPRREPRGRTVADPTSAGGHRRTGHRCPADRGDLRGARERPVADGRRHRRRGGRVERRPTLPRR